MINMTTNGRDFMQLRSEGRPKPVILPLQLDVDCKLLDSEPSIPATPKLSIEFNNLSYAVCCRKGSKKKKDILHSVSGYFRPGRLTAIIGPSGAGKTSLLSIISGLRSSNLKGSITVNGAERNSEVFRRQACYIPQQFALLPLLTVRETLRIAADLKLGSHVHSAEFKSRTVNDIVTNLGLLSCLDTYAGDLSGGERKRLSIGVELITNPPVMLLDEPTSGLDSAGSAQVMTLLSTLAQAGRTVVCAVHQPGSQLISMFDDIVVLSRGRVVYCGPRDEILETFASVGYTCPQLYNIADFVLEVVTTPQVDLDRLLEVKNAKFEANKLTAHLSAVAQNKRHIVNDSGPPLKNYSKTNGTDDECVPRKALYARSGWKQFLILINRSMICAQRDNTLTKLRIAAHLAVGLLLGFVFYDSANDAVRIQSNVACVFTSLLFLFFGSAMPAVQIFPIEAAVILREHLNNWYSLWSYYVAKVLADLPIQIICPTCFLVFVYWLTGQPLEFDRIWRVWLICLLLTILAQSFGIAAGTACGSQIGVFLVPALNLPLFLFAGFFINLGEVSVYLQPLCYISYFRYAFEGVLQALYGNSRHKLSCSVAFCALRSPSRILTSFDMPSAPFYVLILVMLLWILGLHICVYVIFRWKMYLATK